VAAWLGSNRDNTSTPLGIKWQRQPIKMVGFYFSYDEEESNKLNFEEKIKKSKQILNSWIPRNLTLIGKSMIIRTFIISQFLYATGAIHIPNKYIIYNFIWAGRKPKRDILIQSTEDGGINLPDIKGMVKTNRIINELTNIFIRKATF
jgi:hypothetical protein